MFLCYRVFERDPWALQRARLQRIPELCFRTRPRCTKWRNTLESARVSAARTSQSERPLRSNGVQVPYL